MTGVLAVRLDSDGDVLLTGPAIRALGRFGDVDLLVSPAGKQAADLLPGVRSVWTFDAPWSGLTPAPVDRRAVEELVERLRATRHSRAVVFTSFHQSPLPTALLLRLADVPFIVATSEDYPGRLLDVRHPRADGLHEVVAALRSPRPPGGPCARATTVAWRCADRSPTCGHWSPAAPTWSSTRRRPCRRGHRHPARRARSSAD